MTTRADCKIKKGFRDNIDKVSPVNLAKFCCLTNGNEITLCVFLQRRDDAHNPQQ